MIDKKELRIGNRVQWNQFASMGNGELDVNIGSLSYTEFLDPISLTEEQLLKFGFEKSKLGNRTIYSWGRLSFELLLTSNNSSLTVYFDNSVFCFIKAYVHTFQNWWFSVMGEELKLEA